MRFKSDLGPQNSKQDFFFTYINRKYFVLMKYEFIYNYALYFNHFEIVFIIFSLILRPP